MKLTPLKKKIVVLIQLEPNKRISYYNLARKLWPPEKNPKAWNYSSNGGPHGWAMSLGKALRELRAMNVAQELLDRQGGHSHGDVVLLPNHKNAE